MSRPDWLVQQLYSVCENTLATIYLFFGMTLYNNNNNLFHDWVLSYKLVWSCFKININKLK